MVLPPDHFVFSCQSDLEAIRPKVQAGCRPIRGLKNPNPVVKSETLTGTSRNSRNFSS